MAITKVSRGLLSTGIVDNSNATAITIDSSEDVTLANNLLLADGKHILLGPDSGDAFNTESPIRIQDSTNAYINIKAGTGHSGGLLIGDTDDDFMGGLLYNNNTNALTLYSNNGTRATIDSSGNFQISDGNLIVANGHGIDFSATGGPTNGSGNSELLDDYEEGTFTPAFAGSGGNPTVSYQTQQGRYTKIGNLVHVQIRLQTMSVSGGSGNLSITGLPFASATTSGTGSGFSKAFIYNWSTDPETFFTGGDTNIAIYSSDANNTQAQVSHLNTASGPVNYTVIDGTYQV